MVTLAPIPMSLTSQQREHPSFPTSEYNQLLNGDLILFCRPAEEDIFLAWEQAFPREKAIFEAWERWIAEIAGLGTAFPCVPAYFNPCV